MKRADSAAGERTLDLWGMAVAAATAITAALLLASMGRDATGVGGPNPRWMLAQGVAALLALAAAFLLTAKLLRREKEREARGRVAVIGRDDDSVRPALGLACACLALTLVLMAAFETAAVAFSPEDGTDDLSPGAAAMERAREDRGADSRDLEGAGAEGGSAAKSRPRPIGPDDQREDSSGGQANARLGDLLSDEPMLRASSATSLPQATVHLRGLVLDAYDSRGILRQRKAPEPMRHRAKENGWIPVPAASGAAASDGDKLELEVELLTQSRGVVFAPARLTAIETESATHDPTAALWVTEPTGTRRFSVRSTLPSLSVDELAVRSARGSLPLGESTQLPSARPRGRRALALKSLRAYGDALADGAESDLEEVIAVVSHLRGAFGYELYDAKMLTPERSVELIERGSGSCTHFASLAALLLRARGIPTRIAVGYVARERLPLEEGNGWLVRARDGHAWIEVHFEDFGWLTFDPTPGDPTAGGASTGWTPLAESEPAVSRWLDAQIAEEDRTSRSARTSPLGEWVAGLITEAFSTLRDLSRDVARGLEKRSQGGVWAGAVGLVLCLTLGAAWLLRRRRPSGKETLGRPGEGAPEAGPSVRAEPALRPLLEARELMSALAERGLIQPSGSTPTRFAREVEFMHPEGAGLATSIRALIRRASKRGSLSEAELQALKDVAAQLRQPAE